MDDSVYSQNRVTDDQGNLVRRISCFRWLNNHWNGPHCETCTCTAQFTRACRLAWIYLATKLPYLCVVAYVKCIASIVISFNFKFIGFYVFFLKKNVLKFQIKASLSLLYLLTNDLLSLRFSLYYHPLQTKSPCYHRYDASVECAVLISVHTISISL